jgi:UDP-2,3-diacylglucosamine pyrophosphatase LpxH
MNKRKIDIVVLSDIHLGTFGCRAKDLDEYLSTIDPDVIILNGDIIDIWQFSKKYWPKSHMKIIKKLIGFLAKGKMVYYITGNHDELLRKFTDFRLANFTLTNQLVLQTGNQKTWIFHGDIFDVTVQHSKWLAKLGAFGYDSLIILNAIVNWFSEKLGMGRMSLSKTVKNGVKSAISFINDFEKLAAEMAIAKGYDNVICGHIHQPSIKQVTTKKGSIQYLNSGDWVEHLTALEFYDNQWKLNFFQPTKRRKNANNEDNANTEQNPSEVFMHLVKTEENESIIYSHHI